jgi:uncharacterized phage protein (TIGR02218 family)
MQQISSQLSAHLAGDVMTLATCWRVTRRDGVSQYFTDHDVNVVVDGNTYLARTGIVPSAVTSQAGLAVDNLELEGLLDSESITREALLAGFYDHAELEIFMVNYAAPGDGRLHVKTGWLGEVTLQEGTFVAEVRGISAALQQTIGEVYTPTCRAQLGDARCGKDLTAFTFMGTVDTVENEFSFTDAARTEANGYFAYGRISFTSGANTGLSMEIRDFANGRFGLFLPLPNAVQAGDAYSVVAGCDKRIDTCSTRFANAINFRGEPHLPGNDKILETSATRSFS